MKIYFYATDDWGTPEMVRNIDIIVDTLPPNITYFNYTYVNHTTNDLASNLQISFTTDEPADCSQTIIDFTMTPGVQGQFEYNDLTTVHSAYFTNVSDGMYYLVLICNDSFGNELTQVETVNITRVGLLFNLIPDIDYFSEDVERLNNIYIENSIYFSLESPLVLGNDSDPACFITDIEMGELQHHLPNNVSGLLDLVSNDNIAIMEYDYETGQGYKYGITVSEFTVEDAPVIPGSGIPEGNYEWSAVCFNSTYAMFGKYVFGRDNSPPNTDLMFYDTQSPPFIWQNISEQPWSQYKRLRLDCADFPIVEGEPGPAGCTNITYCHTTPPGTFCTPDIEVEDLEELEEVSEEDVSTCWKSYDKLGHYEAGLNCEKLLVDTSAPLVQVTFPPNNYVVGIRNITLEGNWTDRPSGVDWLKVKEGSVWVSGSYLFNEHTCGDFLCGNFTSGNGTHPGPVEYFDVGANDFVVHAHDRAGNNAEAYVTVYYDNVTPSCGVEITSDGNSIPPSNVEYGSPVNFNFTVNDENYTSNYFQENVLNFTIYLDGNVLYSENVSMEIDQIEYTYTIEPEIDPATGLYTIPVGVYTLEYTCADSLGNYPEDIFGGVNFTELEFGVSDTQAPTAIVEVFNTSELYPGWLLTTDHVYPVEINYSEPMANETPVIWFEWTGSPCNFIQDVYPRQLWNVINTSSSTYTADLYLPDSAETCIRNIDAGQITFHSYGSEAVDVNGNLVSEYNDALESGYWIDTASADTPVFVHPGIAGYTHFVNMSDLFVTGYADSVPTPDRLVDLMVKRRDNQSDDEPYDLITELPDVVWDFSQATNSTSDNPVEYNLAVAVGGASAGRCRVQ